MDTHNAVLKLKHFSAVHCVYTKLVLGITDTHYHSEVWSR